MLKTVEYVNDDSHETLLEDAGKWALIGVMHTPQYYRYWFLVYKVLQKTRCSYTRVPESWTTRTEEPGRLGRLIFWGNATGYNYRPQTLYIGQC
jgi:hypothetical protein